MRRIIIGLTIVGLSYTLSACVPTTYGVPNTQWQTMTPRQQTIAMRAYYRQQRQAQEVDDTLSIISDVMPHERKSWGHSHSTTTGSCSGNSCQSSTNTSGSSTSIGF